MILSSARQATTRILPARRLETLTDAQIKMAMGMWDRRRVSYQY